MTEPTEETAGPVRVRTKTDAMKLVAGNASTWLGEGNLDEAAGVDRKKLTKAEVARLEWAVEDVRRRLNRLAGEE